MKNVENMENLENLETIILHYLNFCQYQKRLDAITMQYYQNPVYG